MIKISQACVGEEELAAVGRAFAGGYLGMGVLTRELETRLSAMVNTADPARQAVCVNTGTSALHLAVQACGIGAGDEVIIPSITYVASFQAVSATGATPVACDVLPNTLGIDPDDASKRITPRTRAIMPVHYAGDFGAIEEVYALAREYGLRVIEDAAHAFGGLYKGLPAGSLGDIVCFSFDGIKNITCGEGGAVVSGDPQVLDRVRDARLLGVKNDTAQRYAGKRSWEFDVEEQGWRYHMSNINAAIGLAQLDRLDAFREKRRLLARFYLEGLRGLPLHVPPLDYANMMPHIFPVLAQNAGDRDALREHLSTRGIEAGLHYKPNHLLTKYHRESLPVAEDAYRRLLTLPLHVNLSEEDVATVCSAAAKYLTPK